MGHRITLPYVPYGTQTALQLSLVAERAGLPREYGIRAAIGSATEDETLSMMFALDSRGAPYDVKEAPEWERK